MSWFKIDDKSAFHKKIVDAGNEAWGALCRAGAWSADHLTDGIVPWSVALTIAPRRIWTRLFIAGLCDPRDDAEFQIHDYLDWNPSREQVLKLREHRRSAGSRGGKAKQQATAEQLPSNSSSKPEAKSNPVPVPVPIEEREKGTHTRVDPEVQAIRDRIRQWPIFASLNADRLANEQAGWMLPKGLKLAWVLDAIDAAAAHVPDGANYQTTHSKLVSFMRNARKPRVLEDEPTATRKVVEFKEDPELRERARLAREEKDRVIAERVAREAAQKAGAK